MCALVIMLTGLTLHGCDGRSAGALASRQQLGVTGRGSSAGSGVSPQQIAPAARTEMLSLRSKYAHIWFVLLLTIGARCELIPEIHCLSTVMGKMQLKA